MSNLDTRLSEELLGAIARGWCSKENENKVMDPDLALAIAKEVQNLFKELVEKSEPPQDIPRLGSENADTYRDYANGYNKAKSDYKLNLLKEIEG